VKLIVLLRDPLARAHSHHNHQTDQGFETLDFATAVTREDERLAGEEHRIVADPHYRSFAHQHHSYVARGMYAAQLERWYGRFDAEQILVVASEDLFADPEATVHRIQGWLGLAPHTPSTLAARGSRTYGGSLDEQIGADLRSRFAPDTARLRELTGTQLPWAPGDP
jgi:hypothetical protein